MKEWIYGINPVYECLRAGRRKFYRVLLEEPSDSKKTPFSVDPGTRQTDIPADVQKQRLHEITRIVKQLAIPIERVPRQKLNNIHNKHQGLALEAGVYPYIDLVDILSRASEKHEHPFILILDALQDPQNMGTLLRTAECTGVHGVILPYRHTASITPTVVNSSSGASEHLLISQMNLAQAISTLKQEAIWVIGLDECADSLPLTHVKLDGPLALVVGNEGFGMRSLVKKTCDLLLRLPMTGQVSSLNAAIAGSVALYFAWQARQFKHTLPD